MSEDERIVRGAIETCHARQKERYPWSQCEVGDGILVASESSVYTRNYAHKETRFECAYDPEGRLVAVRVA